MKPQTPHPLSQINFTNLHNAYLIEASAGTGKTWTIERLYIKALLSKNLNINEILVVTFTKPSTQELKERISKQIKETIALLIDLYHQRPLNTEDFFNQFLISRSQTYDLKQDIWHLNNALQTFDLSAIFTLHGFCKEILTDYGLECNLAEFTINSNKNAVLELVNIFLKKHLIAKSQNPQELEGAFNNLNVLFTGKNDSYRLSLAEKISNKLPDNLLSLTNNGYELNYQVVDNYDLNQLFKLKLSREEKEAKAVKNQLKIQFLSAIALFITQEYNQNYNFKDELSYDDLLTKVALSLENNLELRTKIFSKFPVAFIDEFQDTDEIQWKIFNLIYDLDYRARGYLCVVGDPKQSIYSFRGANIDTYLSAREKINNTLALTDNYRSHPQIINFINQLFALKNQNSTYESSFLGSKIDYTPLQAQVVPNNILPPAIELNLSAQQDNLNSRFYDEPVQIIPIKGKNAQDKEVLLYANLAIEISYLLKTRPSLKGKIAILVATNSDADKLVTNLAPYGLKLSEIKLANIYSTITARDLCALFIALSDLGNLKKLRLSLKSQLFNFNLKNLNSEVFNEQLAKFKSYQTTLINQGVLALIYQLVEANPSLNYRYLSNLIQLGELIFKEIHNYSDLTHLVLWLKQKIKTAANSLKPEIGGENEELIRLESDSNDVVILTQHKVKGLEFEVVFCLFFKNQLTLEKDTNYNLPMFKKVAGINKLTQDPLEGKNIVATDNLETNRLNYVTLTRAKSRLYIYLAEVTKTGNKYHRLSKPTQLDKLFGLVWENIKDATHPLFNYPEFFGHNLNQALKQDLTGVAVYRRDSLLIDNPNLSLSLTKVNFNLSQEKLITDYQKLNLKANLMPSFIRQSYSALTSNLDSEHDYYVRGEEVLARHNYKYQLLSAKDLKGASFGLLFHELCENYPSTPTKLSEILIKYNLDPKLYLNEAELMVKEAFNYPLLQGFSLQQIPLKLAELEFSIKINQSINLNTQLVKLLTKYYGINHPFTLNARLLNQIDAGFLNGFIDLFFELGGRYWVLDYKTNQLGAYSSPKDIYQAEDNAIINAMAEHHYYLQYLLYMVAIKRHLEYTLNLDDASHLLGGAVYFFVRGIYLTDKEPGGVFIDHNLSSLISELDALLRDFNGGI